MYHASIYINGVPYSEHKFNTNDEEEVKNNLSLIIDGELLTQLGIVKSSYWNNNKISNLMKSLWS